MSHLSIICLPIHPDPSISICLSVHIHLPFYPFIMVHLSLIIYPSRSIFLSVYSSMLNADPSKMPTVHVNTVIWHVTDHDRLHIDKFPSIQLLGIHTCCALRRLSVRRREVVTVTTPTGVELDSPTMLTVRNPLRDLAALETLYLVIR